MKTPTGRKPKTIGPVRLIEAERKSVKRHPWQVKLEWKDADGKPRRVWRRNWREAEREAERINRRLEDEVGLATGDGSSITFKRAYDDWLKIREQQHRIAQLAKGTMISSRTSAAHVLPDFGRKKLDQISSVDVQTWALDKLKTCSAEAVRKYRGVVYQVMTHAVRRKWIRSNPLRDDPVALPRQRRAARDDIPSYDDIERLISFFAGPRPPLTSRVHWSNHKIAFALGAFGGLRIGEVLGLTWDHVDFARARLRVDQAIARSEIGSPKTPSSIRSLPLAQHLYDALLEHQHATERTTGYLLRNYVRPQKPLSTTKVVSRSWWKLAEVA